MSTRAVIAIFKRNLFAYFGSPTGYVFICAFVLASGFAAFWPSDFFNANLANLDQLNKYIHFILLGFIPAITMSIWADERRQGTDELLLTLPASDLQVVIGKYLAAVAIFTVSLVFSLTNIIVLKWLGDPDMGLLFSTYLGYWFMGLAMLSVGMVASFLTGNLTVAFVMGVAFNVPLVMAGHTDLIVSSASLTESFRGWSLHAHFNDFARGIVSLSSIIYFGVIIGAMLYFCSVLIGRRHWSGTSSRVPLGIHYAARLASILVASISLGWLFSAHDTHSDFTSEKLSVLSPKSIELLEAIPKDRVITIKAYISPEREIPESYVQTRINLMNMLDELEKRAGGRIKVIRHTEVESFKKEATTAEERYGITEQRIFTRHRGRLQDSRIYMGLAFVGGENQQVVVPFLHRGIPVEYELMRSIVSLLDQEKKTLGIVMDADNRGVLMGGFDMRTRQPQPVHPLITELRKQYDVKVIDPAQPMQQYELRDITVNAEALSAVDRMRAESEALERLKKIALPGLGAAGAGIKESQWAEWKQQIDALKAEATANQGLVKLGNTNAVARAKGITNQISVTRKNLENSLNAVRQSTANSGLFHLARMHEKGWGTEANATAARQLYTQLANKLAGSSRDAEHLLKVAAAFGSGLVVMADPTEAERWYGKAVVEYTIIANQGNSPAMIKLGDLFQANRGLPPDLRAAVAAYAELSPMLKPVEEFDPLADEVARWYQNAAGQGDPVGAKRLAALHEGGNGRPRDNGEVARWRRQAVKLLRTRAEQGDAAAMHDLAVAYQRGEGVVPDPAKAAEWFTEALETRRTAAEGGDAEAQFLVGKMLQFGPGPERDPAAAREWFGKAAGQGHAGAQFKLGQMHALGDAGWTDFKTAAEWYTQAAEQGHHQAQWALADLLERGEGVTRDAVAAVKWSMIANQSFEHQLLLDGETRLEVAGRKGKVLYKNYDALLSFQPSAMSPASMPHLINALRAGAPAAILEDPYVALYSRAQVPSTGDPKMGAPQGMGMPPRPSPKADITQLWSLLQIGSLSEDNRTALDRMEIEEEMWSLASGTFPDDRRQRGELGLFMRRFRPFFENVMEETQRKIQAKIRAQETTRANQPEAADRRVSRDEISLWVLEIQADLLTTTIKRLPAGSDQREIFGEALKLLQPLLMAQALKVEQAAVRRNSRRLGERAQRTRNSHIIWHTYNPFPKNDYLDSEIVFTGGTAGGTRPAFNPDHEISAGLQYLLFPFTGSLSAEANATLQFDPLVRTGPTTGLTRGSSMAGGGGRMSSTRERQSTTGAQHVLAAHIHGVPRVEATDVKSSATDLAGRLGKGLILHEKQASVLRELARIDPAAAESFGRWLEGAFSPDEISHGPLSRQMLDLRAAAAKFATALGSVDADRGVEFKALLDEANGTRLLAEDLENIAPRIAAEAALAGQRLRAEDEAAFTAFEKWNGARFWNRIDPATGKLPSPGGNATQPVDAVKILAGLEASLPEVPAGIARQWATRALQRDRFESLAHRRIRERLRGVITETLEELPKRLELLPPQQALQRDRELRVLENEFKTILGARPREMAANMAALRTTAESLVQLLDDHGLAMGLALARVKLSETPGGSSTAEPDTGPTAPWSADYAATDAFSPRINVVLAPDVDFVAPVLFQLRTEGMGTEMGMNLDVDNVTFILNTLDHLADDDRFIAIRNKRRRHRTLTRIEDRTRQGRQEIQAMREKFKEQSRQVSLSAKQDFEKQMDVLLEKNGWHSFARAEAEAEESGGILLLSMDEREEYDNYINAKKVLEEQRDAHVEREENQMKDSRDEEIKREQAGLDRAIRNEERRIKQLAVFLPPIIPLCLGLLVFLTRLRRETTGVSATRIRDV